MSTDTRILIREILHPYQDHEAGGHCPWLHWEAAENLMVGEGGWRWGFPLFGVVGGPFRWW